MIKYLDTHAGAIQAITTVVLLFITGYYSWLTRVIAVQSRKAQRAYLIVDLVSSGVGILEFIVANEGGRAAQSISIDLVDDSHVKLSEQLKEISPIVRGVEYLAPGRTYRWLLDMRDT